MNFFKYIRPVLRIANSLEEIARAMNHFAINDARLHNQIYMAKVPKWQGQDESELLHTDDTSIRKQQHDDFLKFLEQGYPPLEAAEEVDQ